MALSSCADVVAAFWAFGSLSSTRPDGVTEIFSQSKPIHSVNTARFLLKAHEGFSGIEEALQRVMELNPWLTPLVPTCSFVAEGHLLSAFIEREGMHRHPLVGTLYFDLFLGKTYFPDAVLKVEPFSLVPGRVAYAPGAMLLRERRY